MTENYLHERLMAKIYGQPPKEVKKNYIPKKSAKRIIAEKLAKEKGKDGDMDKFFESQRKRMVGVCQCGCAAKSQKDDDTHYRASICHIFPKRIFHSISTNPLNWVERAFYGGCHTNFDEQGMDKWVNMADWEDIKEKFYVLAELLTEQERATKFYSKLEELIYKKQ